MQEERRVANGTEERKPSRPVACGENEDSLRPRGELWSRSRRGRPSSRHLDLRGVEDPLEDFVHLVNSVPDPPLFQASREEDGDLKPDLECLFPGARELAI